MARSSSPDSSISISSLLASCSLGSSSGSSRSTASIEYKDRLYDSATKALEAYIEDYEESLQSPVISTGTITIHPRPGLSDTKPRDHKTRHNHSLPRIRPLPRDPDLLSLTTDDLLCLPSNGSMPFSKVFEQKIWNSVKKRGSSLNYDTTLPSPLLTSSRKSRTKHRSVHAHRQNVPDSFNTEERLHVLREAGRENKPVLYNDLSSLYLPKGLSTCKNYPRWLTSHKSELSISGITSIPNVKYPVWLRDQGLLSDSDSQTTSHLLNTKYLYGPSSLNQLDRLRMYDAYCRRKDYKGVNSDGCLVGRISSPLSDLDIGKRLHTSRDLAQDLPAQNSQPAAEISQKVCSPLLQNNRSPRTEDVLEGERSWEKILYSFKSPVPVLCGDEGNKDVENASNVAEDVLCDYTAPENKVSSFSGGNHHGPVEALKHMLFKLQAFQQNFDQTGTLEQVKEIQKVSAEAESELQQTDKEMFPVNKSLKKALHHLSRLKELVGDGNITQHQDT